MRLLKIIFLVSLFAPICVNAQTRADNEFNFHGNTYSIFMVKIDTASIKKFKLVQNPSGTAHNDFISPYTNNDPNLFITNASVWDSTFKPIGLFVAEGKTINPLNLTDGNQMGFYLKPNGVFIITDKDAGIVESAESFKYLNTRLAVQAGPMLIINGHIHDKFDPNSKNRNLRCGVGIYEDHGAKFLVFALSNAPVTLFDFASLFKDYYHCANALCLQSAGCVMQLPFIKPASVYNRSVGSYIMFVNHN